MTYQADTPWNTSGAQRPPSLRYPNIYFTPKRQAGSINREQFHIPLAPVPHAHITQFPHCRQVSDTKNKPAVPLPEVPAIRDSVSQDLRKCISKFNAWHSGTQGLGLPDRGEKALIIEMPPSIWIRFKEALNIDDDEK